jgi:CO dehydrogenase/acetyl-CoA synthase gamma subunit (corrinoid Fe-S protein)
MGEFKNTMDVFKLLEKTNCRKCNKPTCLAFEAAVFQGQIALSECPFF